MLEIPNTYSTVLVVTWLFKQKNSGLSETVIGLLVISQQVSPTARLLKGSADGAIRESTDILVTGTACYMVKEYSEEVTLSFTGMGGID